MPVVIVPDEWAPPRSGPVVVGVDDDDSTVAALAFAASEAEVAESPLAVIHAWEMPVPRFQGSITLLASPIHIRSEHRTMLRQAAERVWNTVPGIVVEQVLVEERPAEALLRHSGNASMLVLGTHHRGLLAGATLGAVGQEVLRSSRVPICVVPQR